MTRDTLHNWERRCQKPDHRQIGNWMARRISRPLALRLTRVIAPWGVTANMATLAAWTCGLVAVALFAAGTAPAWLAAAVALQAWYLLDHVDGQLARLRGRASLDGSQLDFLMHHSLNLLLPCGVAAGAASGQGWMWLGIGWGTALVLAALVHDTRYKAFFVRLKRLHGRLDLIGGGGGRPVPQPPVPRHPLRLAAWLARKSGEMHVMMNLLTGLALWQWLALPGGRRLAQAYVAGSAITAVACALWTLVRSQRRHEVECEFAAWFSPPPGSVLVERYGWWSVHESPTHDESGFAPSSPTLLPVPDEHVR